jgi:hypothetical protein
VCYRALPQDVQELADEKYHLLKANPRHPSLQLKKVRRFWTARVGLRHRVVGIDAEGVADGIVWFWIGTHGDYDKLVG